MTLTQFIKKLEKIKKQEGGRITVVVDWKSVRNDDYSHSTIDDFKVELINWSINDSYELADGSERQRKVLTLF